MYEFDYQSKGGEKEEEANVREEEESEKGKDEREDVEMQELCDMYNNNKLEFGKKKKITNVKRIITTDGNAKKKRGSVEHVQESGSFLELYCADEEKGGAGLTLACRNKNVMCESPVGDFAGEGTHINKKWIKEKLRKVVRLGKVKVIWISLPCTVWSRLMQFSKNDEEKWAEIEREREEWTINHIIPLINCLDEFTKGGGVVLFEHPRHSAMWKVKELKEAMTRWGGHTFNIDMCTYGSKCKKPTTILTSASFNHSLMQDFRRQGIGTTSCGHERHETQALGPEAKASELYPQELVNKVAKCIKRFVREKQSKVAVRRSRYQSAYQGGTEMTEIALIDSGSQATMFPMENVTVVKELGTQFETEGMGEKKGTSTFNIVNLAIVVEGKDGVEKILIINAAGVTTTPGRAKEANIIDPVQLSALGATWRGVLEKSEDPALITKEGRIFPLKIHEGEVCLPYRKAYKEDFQKLGRPIVMTQQCKFWDKKKYLGNVGVEVDDLEDTEVMKTTRTCSLVTRQSATPGDEYCLSAKKGQESGVASTGVLGLDSDPTHAILPGREQPTPSSSRGSGTGLNNEDCLSARKGQEGGVASTGVLEEQVGQRAEPREEDMLTEEEFDGSDLIESEDETTKAVKFTDLEVSDEESEEEEESEASRREQETILVKNVAIETEKSKSQEMLMKRNVKGRTMLTPENFLMLTPEQIQLTQKFTTRLANRQHYLDGVQKKQAHPVLSMRRVLSKFTMDPVSIKLTRGGHRWAIVMKYTTSGLIVVEGVASITGSILSRVLMKTWQKYGLPIEMRSDSAINIKAGAVEKMCNDYFVEQSFSEPGKQYQNTAERCISRIKRALKIMHDVIIRNGGRIKEDEMLDEYKHIAEILNHCVLSREYGRPALEKHNGCTVDVSHLNLYYYGQEMEIWRPEKISETCAGWVPARYIGTAHNVGNAMCVMVRQNDERGEWNGMVMCTSNHRARTARLGEERVQDKRPPPSQFWMTCHDKQDQYDDFTEEENEYMQKLVAKANKEMEERDEQGEDVDEDDEGGDNSEMKEDGDEDEGGSVDDEWYEYDELKGYRTINQGDDLRITISWKPDGKTKKKYKDTKNNYVFKGDGLAYQAESNLELGMDLAHLILEKTQNKCPAATQWAKAFLKKLHEDGLEEVEKEKELNEKSVRRARCILRCKRVAPKEACEWAKNMVKSAGTTTVQDLTGKARISTSQWMFGIRVPRGKREAQRHDAEYDLDARKKNSLYRGKIGEKRWGLAMEKEMAKFKALNIGTHQEAALRVLERGARAPANYQMVRCFWVFTVKPDGELKARWVAGGNKVDSTGVPSSMTVISAVGVRLMFAQAAADGQEVLAGDLGNAYLHARTTEKVFVRLEEEWGAEFEGRIAVIEKAIYGLVSSAYEFHSYVVRAMHSMNWTQAEGCKDIWIRWNERDQLYDRVGFYVDDVIVTGMNPSETVMEMESHFQFKFSGKAEAYLGSEIKNDNGGGTYFSSQRYVEGAVEKMEIDLGASFLASKRTEWERENEHLDGGELDGAWREKCKIAGEKFLARKNTPMSPTLHPEKLEGEEDELICETRRRRYQSWMGVLTWIVIVGRYDVAYAVNTLGQFNSCPRVGHERAVQHLFGYLKKVPNIPLYINTARITGLPDAYEGSDEKLMKERYPYAEEDMSERQPVGVGVDCGLTVFADASHADDLAQRRSVTGVIMFYGAMPILWVTKRQKVIAGSTYEAEFLALRAAIDEVRGIRYLLRGMGISVTSKARVLGDNEGVLQSASFYGAGLKKKHVGISYHRCREAVACGIVTLHKVPSKENVSDMLTKPLGGESLRGLLVLSGAMRDTSTDRTTSGELE